jgi:hypothetical protein
MSANVRIARFICTAVLLGVWVVPAAAQDLLPAEFAGWRSTKIERVRPEVLEQFAGGEALFLREYRVMAAERRDYSRDAATLRVTLYKMRDPSSAYGAFTFLRTGEMKPAGFGAYSAVSPARGLLVVGHILVDASGAGLESFGVDGKALADALAPHADDAPFPPLIDYLPSEGMVANSERYLIGPAALNRLLPLGNGDWVGFANGAEAQMARYRLQGQDMTLLMLAYPTPQMASAKLAEFGRWFNLNAERDEAHNQPVLFGRRKSSLVAIVAETRSRELAEALLDGISYETTLTWNEPSQSATEPTWAEMVVGSFVGTGILLMFAFMVGIGFGGIRLITKRLFPGKVFDRPGSVEIIQLGIGSKPIKGEDFYED